MNERLFKVNDKEYTTIRLLGKGKGGYSYLVTDGATLYVLKQIHHEPCAYYQFGNKLESEINDYNRLCAIGIKLPKMFAYDHQYERILKEYIEGETIYKLVQQDKIKEEYFIQIREISSLLYQNNTNIDYFPTNFIVQNDEIYYIDYECNDYMHEWNFANWGIKYWTKSQEFLQYVEEHPNL